MAVAALGDFCETGRSLCSTSGKERLHRCSHLNPRPRTATLPAARHWQTSRTISTAFVGPPVAVAALGGFCETGRPLCSTPGKERLHRCSHLHPRPRTATLTAARHWQTFRTISTAFRGPPVAVAALGDFCETGRSLCSTSGKERLHRCSHLNPRPRTATLPAARHWQTSRTISTAFGGPPVAVAALCDSCETGRSLCSTPGKERLDRCSHVHPRPRTDRKSVV